MGIFDELFGGGRGQGFKDLQSALGRGQGAIQQGMGFLEPFRQAGLSSMSQLQQMFGQDPQDIINKIQGNFKETPGFKFESKSAQDALQNQLEAAGLGGSGAAIQQSGGLAQNLAQRGEQQNLQNVLGQRQQQIGGLESLFQTGFGAAGQQSGLEKNIADLMAQQGQAQFGQDVSKSQALSGLFKAIGQGVGSAFGGGFGGGAGGLSSLFSGGGAGAGGGAAAAAGIM